MEPTTVFSLVGMIVTAFDRGYSSFIRWRDRKKKSKGDLKPLETSLNTSGPLVQSRYDESFAVLGNEFAQGDTICIQSLMAQVISLQTKLLGVFQVAIQYSDPDGWITIHLADLFSASETARTGSLNALAGQYQRLAVRRPVPRTPTLSPAASTPPSSLPRIPVGDSSARVDDPAEGDIVDVHRTSHRGPSGWVRDLGNHLGNRKSSTATFY